MMTKPKKLTWLPYQQRLINDRSRYVIVEKSRRIGFDYTDAYKRTMQRVTGENDRDLWYSSADESAAYEYAEYCRYFAGRVQEVVDYFDEHIGDAEDHRGAIKAFCVRFANGSRINCLSSSPRRMRSKGGDVVISEFGFHDDAASLYAAAQPVMMWGDTMTIGSTHNGEGSEFNRYCQDAQRVAEGLTEYGGRPLTPWSRHFLPITLAVDEGLVELINAERGTNFTRDEFLHDLRAGCHDEDSWLQEYMAVPSTETSAWLSYALIDTCVDNLCPLPNEEFVRGGGGRMFAGLDVGRHKDLTVLWLLEQLGDVLWTRGIRVIEKTSIPDQVDILAPILKANRVQRVCVDATGLGLGLGEYLQRGLGKSKVELVTFSAPVKEAMAVPLRTRFEERSIRIPDDAKVREDLHKIRKTITASGNVRFEGERDSDGHADRFWAAALAVEATTKTGGCGIINIGKQYGDEQTEEERIEQAVERQRRRIDQFFRWN